MLLMSPPQTTPSQTTPSQTAPSQTAPSQAAPHAVRSAPADRVLSAAERLATPVQYLKGVGPDRAALLERLGLRTARDVLFFFPRDYQDLTDFRTIAALEEGTLSTVRGVVEETDLRAGETGRCARQARRGSDQGPGGGHLVP